MTKVQNFSSPGAQTRQKFLLDYLREVAKDLMIRGIIRRQQGATIIELLQQEPSEMLGSIVRDLKEAGFSLKGEIVGGIAKMVFGAVFGGGG